MVMNIRNIAGWNKCKHLGGDCVHTLYSLPRMAPLAKSLVERATFTSKQYKKVVCQYNFARII